MPRRDPVEDSPPAAGMDDLLVRTNGHRDLTPDEKDHLAAELSGLHRRLETLPVIEQSKGLLIGYFAIDADAAFALLRRWSMESNLKLRDVSAMLVAAATSSHCGAGQPNRALDVAIRRFHSAD